MDPRGARFTLAAAASLALLASPSAAQCTPEEATSISQTLARWFGGGDGLVLDGDTLAVGAKWSSMNGVRHGTAYVYERNLGGPGAWGLAAGMEPPSAPDEAHFGSGVGLSGDTLAVGAPGEGAVYVYERDLGGPGSWGLERRITGGDHSPDSQLGYSVALEGDVLVAGAVGVEGAFVFERDAGGPNRWGRVAFLRAEDSFTGDGFGFDVALAEGTIVVGAVRQNGVVANTGAAYVFEDRDGGWRPTAKLFARDGGEGHTFGHCVVTDGETIAVGAPTGGFAPGVNDPGAAYVFERTAEGSFAQAARLALSATTPPISKNYDRFGSSLGLWGSVVLVGVPGRSLPLGKQRVGRAFFFARDQGGSGVWGLVPGTTLGPEELKSYDSFGSAVALEGNTAAVGAANSGVWGRVFVFDGAAVAGPSTYCEPGLSASGCRATLSATGAPSASAPSGFDLVATAVEGATQGLFLFGTGGRVSIPWGNGSSARCVTAAAHRSEVLAGGGTSGACDGSMVYDLAARWSAVPAQNPGPGALVQTQLWYRDSASTSNRPTSFSDALEFTTCP